jgi:SAM-dependent methyltransferase
VASKDPACSVCGATDWQDMVVIWDELADEWGINSYERAYVDRQQGTTCRRCGTSMRSAALADAVRTAFGWRRPFDQMRRRRSTLRILEINEAGTLTPTLEKWKYHRLVNYPDVDMMALPFEDETFDLVVHSDTLEHVSDPVKGLLECHRVLRPGAYVAYTVPVILGRMTRTRDGLPDSFHGARGEDNYLVHTEYGADFWQQPLEAGFPAATLHAYEYPAALAVLCQRT